jgi:hypothetical protein
MALGLASEIHFDGDMPAAVNMHVTVPFQFELVKAFRRVSRCVLVGAVLDIVRLLQGLVPFPDVYRNVGSIRRENAGADEDITERVGGCGLHHFRLHFGTVNEDFELFRLHPFLLSTPGLVFAENQCNS